MKKALLVSSDSRAKKKYLQCVNDVALMLQVLLGVCHFLRENIFTLVNLNESSNHPTLVSASQESNGRNIKSHLLTMAQNCQKGDVILLYLSGHSGVCFGEPIFFGSDGCCVRGSFLRCVARNMAAVSRVTVLIDSCYSGGFFKKFFKKPPTTFETFIRASSAVCSMFSNGYFGLEAEDSDGDSELDAGDGFAGLYCLAACGIRETAKTDYAYKFEDYQESTNTDPLAKYGLFTKCLTMELILKGGNIKNSHLFEEVSYRVFLASKRHVAEVGHNQMKLLDFLAEQ